MTIQSYKKQSDLEVQTYNFLSKMVFSEYMNSLPNVKVEEIKKIAELTFSTPVTVYRWISGALNPPMVKKKIIAEYLGRSVEELFPE